MTIRGTAKFEKGRSGERFVVKLLQEKGWHVIPSYDYCGEGNKAPRMEGARAFFVIPDLDASKRGQRMWVEVKTKRKADYTRITDRLEHGIPKRHNDDYLRVQQESGTPVWLVICEEDTGDILVRRLDELQEGARQYSGKKMSYGGMVFFARDAFSIWCKNVFRLPIG